MAAQRRTKHAILCCAPEGAANESSTDNQLLYSVNYQTYKCSSAVQQHTHLQRHLCCAPESAFHAAHSKRINHQTNDNSTEAIHLAKTAAQSSTNRKRLISAARLKVLSFKKSKDNQLLDSITSRLQDAVQPHPHLQRHLCCAPEGPLHVAHSKHLLHA
jgi:hypothetical protein